MKIILKKYLFYSSLSWIDVFYISKNGRLLGIILQLNFSLEKAGILLVLVLVFSIQAKAYSQTRITAKRQGVTIDEVLKEVREKSGYRFLYRVEEVNRYGKRDIDVKDAEVEDFLGQLLQNTDLTYEVENEVIIIRPEKQRPSIQMFPYISCILQPSALF